MNKRGLSSQDDAYNSYLANLVSLFSTDRRLLEARGSLIIRQLCTTLHTERVFRSLAEILEKDEDLEFASIMITNLNMILITSPELADFRKRLKNRLLIFQPWQLNYSNEDGWISKDAESGVATHRPPACLKSQASSFGVSTWVHTWSFCPSVSEYNQSSIKTRSPG